MSPVESSNSLIIRGPEDLVYQAQDLAQELDKDAIPEGPIIKVYDLPEGVAIPTIMIRLIEDLMSGRGRFGRRGLRQRPPRVSSVESERDRQDGNEQPHHRWQPAEKIPLIEQLIQTQKELLASTRQDTA